MTQTNLYPLLLDPAVHVKVWGGRRLADVMGKTLPDSQPYGEAWEMHDTARVVNGALCDRTLGDLLEVFGADLIGKLSDSGEGVPLLVKLLDATDWLSVQVHPNDAQAYELEGELRGKTEAWYVIAAEPDSRLVIGVEPGTTREQMAAAIRENRLEPLLVYADVVPGDVLYIPAGTIHALGPGILIYEIQQSSDTTYRLYDWGRLGLDGSPRQLHIEKGVRVSQLDKLPAIQHTGSDPAATVSIVDSPFFETTLHQLAGSSVQLDTRGEVFHVVTCIAGSATLTTEQHPVVTLETGQTVFIPAVIGHYALAGSGKFLRSNQRA